MSSIGSFFLTVVYPANQGKTAWDRRGVSTILKAALIAREVSVWVYHSEYFLKITVLFALMTVSTFSGALGSVLLVFQDPLRLILCTKPQSFCHSYSGLLQTLDLLCLCDFSFPNSYYGSAAASSFLHWYSTLVLTWPMLKAIQHITSLLQWNLSLSDSMCQFENLGESKRLWFKHPVYALLYLDSSFWLQEGPFQIV